MTTLAPAGQVYRLTLEPNQFNDYVEYHYSTTLEPLLKKLRAALPDHMKGELALLRPQDAVSDYGRQEIIKHAKNRPGSSGLSTSVLEAMAIIKGFTEHRSDGPYITRKTTRHGINVSTAHALIRRGLARESFGRPGNNHITLTDEGRQALAEAGPVEVSV